MSQLKTDTEKAAAFFVKTLKDNIQKLGKVDTGELLNSVSYEVIQTANEITMNILASDTLDYVDRGRKKGKFPNVTAITRWAERKGIHFDKATPEQVGYVIARSIARKGIVATNVVQKTIDQVVSNISEIIGDAYRTELVDMIDSMFNKK